MELRDIVLLISATTGITSLTSTAGLAIYAFAVLRTQVQQMQKDNEYHYLHANNTAVHFNHPAFHEFEKRIEGEISSLRTEVGEVKKYCKEIDEKVDKLK